MKKETEELSFSPKIIKNFKIGLEISDQVLQNPNSFNVFVDRQKQKRIFINQIKRKQITAVGTGIHWKNQITVPNGPSFLDRPKLNRSMSLNYVRYCLT